MDEGPKVRSVEDALKRFPELGRARYGSRRIQQLGVRLTAEEYGTLQAVCKHWGWNYRQWIEYCLLRFMEQSTKESMDALGVWYPPSPTVKLVNCLVYEKMRDEVMAVLKAYGYESMRFATVTRWAMQSMSAEALATPPTGQRKMLNWERHGMLADVKASARAEAKVEVPGTDFDLAISTGKRVLTGLDEMLAAAQPPAPKLTIVPPAPAQEAPATLLQPGDPMPLPFPDDIEDDYTGDA